MFHIHDESPERHKASFWVSRLNDKGTDAGIGAIPNSPRAKYYIEQQGEGTRILLNDIHTYLLYRKPLSGLMYAYYQF